MPRHHKLRDHVRVSVAAQAATALARMPRHLLTGEAALPDEAGVSLHESFPIWLLPGDELERLRADRAASPPNLIEYLHKTSLWLHLLYRGEQPIGYVHGRHLPKGRHQVTNVSITTEAEFIRQAIDQLDRAAPHEAAHAAILECPKASVAGVILFPVRRKGRPRICVFRDPSAPAGWSPSAPMEAAAFIDKLLQLQVISSPSHRQGGAVSAHAVD